MTLHLLRSVGENRGVPVTVEPTYKAYTNKLYIISSSVLIKISNIRLRHVAPATLHVSRFSVRSGTEQNALSVCLGEGD